jgi:hypothetical protein
MYGCSAQSDEPDNKRINGSPRHSLSLASAFAAHRVLKIAASISGRHKTRAPRACALCSTSAPMSSRVLVVSLAITDQAAIGV